MTARFSFFCMSLVQLLECEIVLAAAGFLVVETVHSHILFFDFNCSIIEWVSCVMDCSHCNLHIRSQDRTIAAFNALGVILNTLAIFVLFECFGKSNIPFCKSSVANHTKTGFSRSCC